MTNVSVVSVLALCCTVLAVNHINEAVSVGSAVITLSTGVSCVLIVSCFNCANCVNCISCV